MNIFKILKWLLLDQFTLSGIGGGKGGGGSSPSYPDPNVVAQATTNTNENTAAFNKALNLNNNSNPFGSQQSTQVGTDPTTGAPIYNTTVSANPQLQNALSGLLGSAGNSSGVNQNSIQALGQLNDNLSNIAGVQQQNAGWQSQFASAAGGLAPQYAALAGQLSPNAARDAQQQGQNAAYAAQTQYLDPQFSQQKESLDAQLANQGLTPGSQAYNNAMLNYNNQKQQAYSNAQNQSILTGSQIGTQNLNNQINGINTKAGLIGNQAGLFGLGSQILGGANASLGAAAGTYGQNAGLYGQQVGIGQLPYSNLNTIAGMIPGYSGTGQSSAAPADIAGLYNNQYQSQLAGSNASQSSSNSMMSGLFGLGSSALMGYMMSDRRAKRDIKRVGTFPNGLPVYTYRYIGDKVLHLGFMADEVRKVAPHAVLQGADGFDRVNYRLAA
jgi:hypothetical protein